MNQLNLFGQETFDTLYRKTSTGAIQQWRIWVEGNVIFTEYGQHTGKKQIDKEEIKCGKNIGKLNETTPEQQAWNDAKSKWQMKYKKDYKSNIDDVLSSECRLSKDGGYLPMLAHSYNKYAHKLMLPCYIQPKLDGIRSISIKSDGIVNLFTRSGKIINTLPHICNDLNILMNDGEIFDGELYTHEGEFESFTGAIRAEKNTDIEKTQFVKYHIYDAPRIGEYVETNTFTERWKEFTNRYMVKCNNIPSIEIVDTILVHSDEVITNFFKEFLSKHYEGAILRNVDMPYVQNRSYNLLKLKEFDDSEFEIVGFNAGKGDTIIFICKCDNGTFDVTMDGTKTRLKEMFTNGNSYIGKYLNVQHFGFTNGGKPRFGVGKRIRDNNDY